MPVFFPFGIPTTSSRVEKSLFAINAGPRPEYLAPYADRALQAPIGSPAANATACPPGYENALNPSNPSEFPPVPSQAIDRSGYLLCFPTADIAPSPTPFPTSTPATPAVTPSATPITTPNITPTPSPILACYSLGTFNIATDSVPVDPSNCGSIDDEYTGTAQLFSNNCQDLSNPIGCTIYTENTCSPAGLAFANTIRAFNNGTYYILNSSSQIAQTGTCLT